MFQGPFGLSVYYGTYGTPFAYSAYSFHVPWLRQVIFALRMAAGPGAGTPPPEVVGAALHQAKVLHGLRGLRSKLFLEDEDIVSLNACFLKNPTYLR